MEFNDYLEFKEGYLRNPTIGTYSRGFFYHPMYQNFESLVKMLILFKKIPQSDS